MTTQKNLIRTNTKIYRNRIYKYLLECITFEEEGTILDLSDKQKIEYFFNDFENWSNDYEKNRTPNVQNRLESYLRCMPIDIAHYNDDILELAKELHGAKELTEKEKESILKYYWSHMAFMLLKLKETLNKK